MYLNFIISWIFALNSFFLYFNLKRRMSYFFWTFFSGGYFGLFKRPYRCENSQKKEENIRIYIKEVHYFILLLFVNIFAFVIALKYIKFSKKLYIFLHRNNLLYLPLTKIKSTKVCIWLIAWMLNSLVIPKKIFALFYKKLMKNSSIFEIVFSKDVFSFHTMRK